MRVVKPLSLALGLGLALGVAWATDVTRAVAYSPMVTMIDNDAPTPNQSIDAGQGYWGYGPSLVHVKKGEQIAFHNPSTNKRPHSVTSISLGSTPFENGLVAGAKFDSSPTRETLVTPG